MSYFSTHKKILLALFTVLLLSLAAFIYIKYRQESVNGSRPLTEAEKSAILAELAKENNTAPLSDTQKTEILTQIQKEQKNPPLTEEQKTAILLQLSQGN